MSAAPRRGEVYDAIIVGGGPAGATAALLLARAGWSVALVEQSQFPRRKVCGEYVSAASLPLLHALGVAGVFLVSAGPEIKRVGLFAERAMLSAPMPPLTAAPQPWGRALSRERLDALLLQHAVRAGAHLWQPCKVTGVELACGVHRCRIVHRPTRDVIELRARLAIAAHGSWHAGAWPWLPEARTRGSDLLGFKAHFGGGSLPLDLMPMLVFPGGYGGMVHTDSGRVSLSCCVRRDQLQRARGRAPDRSAGDALLAHIQDSCAGVREVLAGARRDGAWLAAGPIRPAIRVGAAQRVFLLGNAAGEAHPIIAEGISMALQSAALLCGILIAGGVDVAAGSAFESLQRAYAAQWRNLFALRVHAAAVFAHVAMRPWAAAAVLPLLKAFPALLTEGARWSGKIEQPAASVAALPVRP